MNDVTVTSLVNLQNEVRYGDGSDGHSFITDEPKTVGGDDRGPDPYTLLMGALGSCISMTVTMYARHKAWPLERVTVRLRQQRVHAKDCQECEMMEGFALRIERAVTVEGELSDEQRARLIEIALKCPIHRTLTSEIVITEMQV
ncbi:MAG: OsmC family protein [Pyrinomonadaceae bacterium]|jgi:putative redox protein|nr:OsmC family protein [Pyrinomonadaceae bacterium]